MRVRLEGAARVWPPLTGALLGALTLCGVFPVSGAYADGENLLVNGSFETWHPVSGQGWGDEEPDDWHGWEIFPWTPPGSHNPDHITIQMDRATGIPTPPVKDGDHRVGMDRGWRSCYGGIYQEVTGLSPNTYVISGWVAWLNEGVTEVEDHVVEVLVKDGLHTPDAVPTGTSVFSRDGSTSNLNWDHFEQYADCTTGTLTVYANLRADDSDGASFAHLDGFELRFQSGVQFYNFQVSRVANGDVYDVTISWETGIPTTTQIEWGPTTDYGFTSPFEPDEVTHHMVQLNGVTPQDTPYHYRVVATASGGIQEYSLDRTFNAPIIVLGEISSVVDPGTGTVCTIEWSSDLETTTNKVYYREAGAGSYIEAADAADPASRTSHSVSLIGLALDTHYEYYVESASDDLIAAVSTLRSFQTPAQPGLKIELGMAMIGRGLAGGYDDTGPAQEVQDMIERDHPLVTVSSMPCTTWAQAQPYDPGGGPNLYDWSSIDARADEIIPGKALFGYYQMYGTSPDWADRENDPGRFWQKFEEFVEAMTIYINQNYGTICYTFENEPNISRAPDGWDWDDWYIYCLQHFYAAVHRADSQTGMENKVCAGNLCGHSASGFEDLYARGLKDCSDILGYHPYPYDIRDGLDVSDLALIHAIQVSYADEDKKIWVSEGWGSGRSAGFDRSTHLIEPTEQEIENMYLAMVNGWDNVMAPRDNWHPDNLWGMKFFCGNDNWGMRNWRSRAIPQKNERGDIIGFRVDGYWMTPDIAPQFWNGGMLDFYGNSKDCLIHVFPGDGLAFMNPGFELPSAPPNVNAPHFWTPQVDPAPVANYGLDHIVFHGGSRSLKLTQDADQSNGVYQVTAKRAAIGGVSYQARVWCRTEDTDGLAARFYMCFLDLDGARKSAKYWATDVTGTTDWQQMEIGETAPSYTKRIEVGCYIHGVGTAWFDDVTISKTSDEESGTVRGYTLDENQIPVPQCPVRTTTGDVRATSDENGYYEMAGAPAGTYDFVCRKAGYVPHRVKNQTIAAGKLTLVNFSMGVPKAGLTVMQITCDREVALPGGNPAVVTVAVANSKPYPNMLSEVNIFVEQDGTDATEMFTIDASPANPQVIPQNNEAEFEFALTAKPEAEGQSFEINAYTIGQEDRPNLIEYGNGGFDREPWDNSWSFSRSADQISWDPDETDYCSPPRALKCYVSDDGEPRTYNWAHNYSAYGPHASEAYPAQSYTVGVRHQDNITGSISVNLFIQEYYYNGEEWFYNGRRFNALGHRSVWSHDIMIYETGDPNVTEGLYPTNRLIISCGVCTSPPTPGSGYSWWDDLYVKETGDWLADDRADTGVSLTVEIPEVTADFDDDGDVDPDDFAIFQSCATAPNVGPPASGCVNADLDGDNDVDQSDFGLFQRCISGSGNAADPDCAN